MKQKIKQLYQLQEKTVSQLSQHHVNINICWMLNEMSLDRVEGNLRELIRSLLANTAEEKLRKGNTESSVMGMTKSLSLTNLTLNRLP